MIAVITADIINSTQNNAWQDLLKSKLNKYGTAPMDWNIYRGDSFQIRIPKASQGLTTAVYIKSVILQLKNLDVRIAIGIGDEESKTKEVTQNTGTAYLNSGRLFDELKTNLEIRTPWADINDGLNAGLNLVNTIVEQWTPIMSSYILIRLDNPEASQKELAEILNTTQSNVSRVLSRASWQPIEQYLHYFSSYITSLS